MKLTVVAKNILKEGKKEDVLKLVEVLIEETRKEEGCISYNLYEGSEDENILTFIEEWNSEEAFQLHLNSNHFKEIVPKLSEFMESSKLDVYKKLI